MVVTAATGNTGFGGGGGGSNHTGNGGKGGKGNIRGRRWWRWRGHKRQLVRRWRQRRRRLHLNHGTLGDGNGLKIDYAALADDDLRTVIAGRPWN